MPELTCELFDWETKAFDRKRRPASLSIEVDADAAVITGPANLLRRAMDLGGCRYVEFDGFIRAVLDDPIPNRARQAVNGLLHKLRRIGK